MNPTDPTLNVARGRYLTGEGRLDEARAVLEATVRERPGDLSAQAAMLACLREADATDELSQRMAALPPQSLHDPWLLLIQRGKHANQSGNPEDAAAAFGQLLNQDRTCSEAWAGQAQAALMLKDLPKRKQALAMTAGLARIQNRLTKITRRPDHPESFLDIADLCAELALDREGRFFVEYARKLSPDNPRVLTTIKTF